MVLQQQEVCVHVVKSRQRVKIIICKFDDLLYLTCTFIGVWYQGVELCIIQDFTCSSSSSDRSGTYCGIKVAATHQNSREPDCHQDIYKLVELKSWVVCDTITDYCHIVCDN